MAAPQARVVIQLPTGVQSIGVHDNQRPIGKGVREFLEAWRMVAGGSAVRDHEDGLASLRDDSRNVTDSGIAHAPVREMDVGHGNGGSPRAAEGAMHLPED